MSKRGLIADIGATNARFALSGLGGVRDEKILKCADYPGIAEAAEAYLDEVGQKVGLASVAIAGPVKGDRFEMTNHPWHFSISETKQRLELDHFHVMNDFEAIALSIPHLEENKDFKRVYGEAGQKRGPIGIIGPGTGLGVASLFWDGTAYRPVSGEGGHVTMPAKTQREFDVFQWLLHHKYTRHISAERVCSGKGLGNIYMALKAIDGRDDLPELEPEEISTKALDGSCSLCAEALDLLMGFLGCVAGNLALTIGAKGGIYIAGGIVLKLGEYFEQSRYREEFLGKGRFKDYLEPIPTYVISHDFPAFVGLHADMLRQQAT